jgi:putative ABC transport system permease protein
MFGESFSWIALAICLALLGIFGLLAVFSRQTVLLSLRSVLRNRRRTLITAAVIGFGVTGLMLLCGFIENAFTGLREATITSGLGHIKVYKKGYNDKGVIDKSLYAIHNYEELKKLFREDPVIGQELKAVSANVEFTGLIASSEASAMCMGRGVESGTDGLLSSYDKLVEGKPIGQGKYADDGVIGLGLSRALGAKINDTLTLLVASRGGAMNALDMGVGGIIQGADQSYDNTIVKMPLSYAQRLLGSSDVSEVVLLLRDTKATDTIAQRLGTLIRERNLGLEYRTWYDLAGMYQQVRMLYMGMFMVFLIIMLVVVVLSILNTMMMSVMERVREIGILRSMGTSRPNINRLFLSEGFLLGIAGATGALLMTLLVLLLVNVINGGIPIPPPPGRTMGYRAFFDVLQHPWIIAFGYMIAMVTSLISSILPARRAARMDIVQALRSY